MLHGRLVTIRRALIATLIVPLVLGLACVVYMEKQGNFHTITDGEAYRSGLMDGDILEYYIRKYSIKSIVNLSGITRNNHRYDDEISLSKKYGLSHYDLGFPATSRPSALKLKALVEIFRTAPRPILIHCKNGADRAGLAAAMWKVVIDGESKAEAERCLSLRYGHLPFGKTQVLDDTFRKWEP